MPLKIRLSRGGNKKRPHYRIVLADSRAPRDGKFIERLGTYNPLLSKDNDQRIVFNEERIKHWLKNGAKPTDRVTKFLSQVKIIEDIKRDNPNKAKPKAKAQERAQALEDAKIAAEEEKAKAAEAPAEEAKAEEAPAEEAPADEAPAEEAPVEEAKAEEAPVEEAKAEEAKAEEAPAEEAPAEEAPAAESSADDEVKDES